MTLKYKKNTETNTGEREQKKVNGDYLHQNR